MSPLELRTPVLTSDVYERAPGGIFIVHSASGKIGETAVGGVEIIGVDREAYRSTFCHADPRRHDSGRPPCTGGKASTAS
jgi:hypothetical protein